MSGYEYEVCWKMYGTATIKADSMEEAVNLASKELIHWNGFGTDFVEVSVDGADVEA
jgi:hypothetical protein